MMMNFNVFKGNLHLNRIQTCDLVCTSSVASVWAVELIFHITKGTWVVMCVHVQVEKHMREQAAGESASSATGAQTSLQ